MIEGVAIKKLKVIPDERGRLMEILRCDDEIYQQFGQVYMTTVLPGVVKGWHYHKVQCDHFCCLRGMIKVVLYDSRKDSSTCGEVNEFFIGIHNPVLIKVPPFVFHGFKGISTEESVIVNIPTQPYNYKTPDEFRVDAHKNDIPYDWNRKDG
ncbi:MAG: dTDP-4-dehydrorhamnose 3,5-epimerase family protein [Candidatus Omnitrophota bacterium]